MLSLLIITEDSRRISDLRTELAGMGFACAIATRDEISQQLTERMPDLILLEIDGQSVKAGIAELAPELRQKKRLPVIALINKETLNRSDFDLNAIDDFIVKPCEVSELVLRIKRLLQKARDIDTGEMMKCGDLIIDRANCEVFLNGRLVELTFKEYELLKFLAGNQGRVFSREALLNKVWGYDYYGGDRTVDVHIRRLRSKIEDASHTFIETVRNIGYRFRRHT